MRNFRDYLNILGEAKGSSGPRFILDFKEATKQYPKDVIDALKKAKINTSTFYGSTPKYTPNTMYNIQVKTDELNIKKIVNYFNADYKSGKVTIKFDSCTIRFISSKKSGNAGSNITAADWEKVIVVAHNMLEFDSTKEAAIKMGQVSWAEKLDNLLDLGGYDIAKNLHTIDNSKFVHYGSGSSRLTSEWEQYFIDMTGKPAKSATKTPKTDFYSKNIHYSLKKEGGSQLMSGGKAESLATLAFAFANTPDYVKNDVFQSAFDELTDEISESFKRYTKIGTINDIKKDIKAGKKSKLINDIDKQIRKNNEMSTALRKLTSSSEFKSSIVKEAMTGDNKFSDYDSKADYLMVFNEIGDSKVQKIDPAFVSNVANKTRFDISFKASDGDAWVAMKGVVRESQSDLLNDSLLEETFIECLNEYELNEGILDKVKLMGNKLLSFVKSWVKKIIDKIKSSFTVLLKTFGQTAKADISYEF